MAFEYQKCPSEQVRNELVVRLMGVAERVAARYSFMKEHDDIVSVAYESLLDSVTRFDPSRGVPVAKFAAVNAIQSIKRHLKTEAYHRLERCPSDIDSSSSDLRIRLRRDMSADGKIKKTRKRRKSRRKKTLSGTPNLISAEILSQKIQKETGIILPACAIISAAEESSFPDGTVAVFQTAIYLYQRKVPNASKNKKTSKHTET